MNLDSTGLLWLPPTGKKYHIIGKAESKLYYSFCGRMIPNKETTELSFGPLAREHICKRCLAAAERRSE